MLWAWAEVPTDFVFVGGQSQHVGFAVNYAAAPQTSAFEYVHSKRALRRLREPTYANGQGRGSPLSAFAARYRELKPGRQLVLHNAAKISSAQQAAAATTNGHWDAPGSGGLNQYDAAVAELDDALADLAAWGRPFTFRGVWWDQGGTDAQEQDSGRPGVTDLGYKNAFVALIARFRARYDPNLPFFVGQLGQASTGDTAGWQAIRARQAEVVAEVPNVYMVFDRGRFFPAEGKMQDTVHYNMTGANEDGTTSANGVAALVP